MSDVTMSVLDNGPLIVKGSATLVDAAGTSFPEQKQMALCRCGASQNKPFCDGSHGKVNFEAAERAPES